MIRPKVSFVILNWKKAQLTKRAIGNIRNQTGIQAEIIVVDNESIADNSSLKSLADKYVRNLDNRGFAAACNQGASMAKYDFVAFINNDALLPSDWAIQAVVQLGRLGAAAISGGEIINSKLQYSAAVVHPRTALVRQWRKLLRKPLQIPYCYGSNLLLRKKEFFNVGGFTESYFAYYEDVDLCAKLYARGKKCIYDPCLTVRHDAGRSTGESNADFRNHLIQTNKYRLIARHFSAWLFWLGYTCMYDIGKYFVGTLVALLTTRDDTLKSAKLSVYRAQLKAPFWVLSNILNLAEERKSVSDAGLYASDYRMFLKQFKHELARITR